MWYSPSLQQLVYLEAVLEEGSFVRAAERLNTTHSTISRSLKTLTAGLGIGLFDRTPQGLKASAIGKLYGAHIRKSLAQARLAFDLARFEAHVKQRPFYVGHSPYIHGGLLPVIEKLTLPGNDAPPLRLRSASTTQLVWRVRRGELQAAFGVLPIIDKTLWIERVAEEPFCVCLPEHHRLANHSRLPARELSEETVAWIPRSFHRLLYDQVMSYLRTLGFSAERFKEAQTITQALDFVAIGTGIALVPQSASRFQRRGVVFRSLTDDLIRIETALFVQKEQMRSSVKDFISAAMSATAFLRHRP